MPKIKIPIVSIMPLCLKFRGRIVGAVSRSRLGICFASGLLLLSSLLLLIILINMKYDHETITRPEERIEEVSIPVQNVNAIIPIGPESISKSDALVISPSIKGPIQVDFGWQFHQVYNDWRYHTGIDINGPLGQTVEAIDKGQVVEIVRDSPNGLTVVVKNNTTTVYYGALSELRVSEDDHISAGQTIGVMGTCDAEPYYHLHLAIQKDGQYIDPKLIINGDKKQNVKN